MRVPQSPLSSTRTAVTRLCSDSSLGNSPAARVRRFSSLLWRSSRRSTLINSRVPADCSSASSRRRRMPRQTGRSHSRWCRAINVSSNNRRTSAIVATMVICLYVYFVGGGLSNCWYQSGPATGSTRVPVPDGSRRKNSRCSSASRLCLGEVFPRNWRCRSFWQHCSNCSIRVSRKATRETGTRKFLRE